MAEEISFLVSGVLLLLYMWFVIPSATISLPAKNAILPTVWLPPTTLSQHQNNFGSTCSAFASVHVGRIDVRLMMYLVPAQVGLKFEFKSVIFFLKLLASDIDYQTNKCFRINFVNKRFCAHIFFF